MPHSGQSNLTLFPFSAYDHLTMTIIFGDTAPSGSWLIIVSPSGSKPSIFFFFWAGLRDPIA